MTFVVRDDTDLLDAMMDDMSRVKGVHQPGAYWKPHADRMVRAIGARGLSSFRSDPGVGRGFADVPMSFKARVKGVVGRSERNIDKRWLAEFVAGQDIPDTLVGNPARRLSTPDGEVGEAYLRVLTWLADYDIDWSGTVLEIGGGFGAMAHTIMHRSPVSRYIYVDIPPVLYVGTQYLRAFMPVRDYREGVGDGVSCIAPWQLQDVNAPVDFVWNANSFQEMPLPSVEDYGEQVGRLLAPEGKVGLFLYDRPDDRLLKNQQVLDCFRGIHFTEVQMDATSHVLAGRGYVGTRPR